MPQLDESVAAHLCPPTAIGWKAKASHPSKPCRTTSALAGRSYASAGQAASALHSMAVLQVYQAKLLSAVDESEPDPATLRELRSATDLALRATKTTAQAIGRSMASLVVLERHLWLTLTEIKDADRVSFLDAPISPSGLFGPYATLPAQALQPSSCSESPQDCADSAVCETCTCRLRPSAC